MAPQNTLISFVGGADTMGIDRRRMLTLFGSTTSTLPFMPYISPNRSNKPSTTESSNRSISYRTVFLPGSGSGKIQKFDDEDTQIISSFEDRQIWLRVVRSMLNAVNVEPPEFPGFDLYNAYVERPQWHIAYTRKRKIIDILDGRDSNHNYKALILEKVGSRDKTVIEANDFNELVGQVRECL